MLGNMHSDRLAKSFKKLIADLRRIEASREDIEAAKEELEDVIGSRRDYESATTVSALISLLDKRDELGPLNVRHLYGILERESFAGLRAALNEHGREMRRFLAEEFVREPCADLQLRVFTEHVFPEKVISLLASSLNDSWLEVAKIIELGDWNIQVIESMDVENEEKIKEMLKVYAKEGRFLMKRGRLLNALAQIRRNDLRMQVQKSFMEPCLCPACIPL
ncbi:uncharacterized protein LOC106667584 [Cimex lectularius]|uniref:Death domain-containing protein n=1 Tax=Cimex lectularius TaxID=79782 RepID=A0A8I6RTJ9_CIMLE|nr:uncharacterized protein LOC106667584 [Cimex lectularius]